MLDDLFAFLATELDCARCGSSVAIADLLPYARGGFVCRRCLVEMPTGEYRDLLALGQEFSVG